MTKSIVDWFIVREKYCSLAEKVRLISQANKAIVCFPLYELDALQIFPQSQTQWGGGLCWLTAERNKHWCLDPKIIPAYCSLLHVILPVSCSQQKCLTPSPWVRFNQAKMIAKIGSFNRICFPTRHPKHATTNTSRVLVQIFTCRECPRHHLA